MYMQLRSFNKIALALFLSFSLSAIFSIPVGAQEPTPDPATRPSPVVNNANNVCKGILSTQEGSFTPNTTIASCQEDGDEGFGFLAKRIIDIFSIVVGAVSVIMIIIGGFRYIISGGDSNGIQGAKNTILYAIVGLVIVLFAQVIVRFVLVNATGATR